MPNTTQPNETHPSALEEQVDALLHSIGKALKNDQATWANLAALVDECEKIKPELAHHAEQAAALALAPFTSRAVIASAKAEAESAKLDFDRLETALSQLHDACDAQLEIDDAEARVQRFRDAEAQRNQLAQQIKDEFPAYQKWFVALCSEIVRVNALIDAVNNDQPEGEAPLQRPEGHARGFHDHGSYHVPASFETLRIVQSVLPDLEREGRAAWPPINDYAFKAQRTGRFFTMHEVLQMAKAT